MTSAKEAKEKINNYIKQIDETKVMQKISKILDKINDKDMVNRIVSWLYAKYCSNNMVLPTMPLIPYQPPKTNPYTETVLYAAPIYAAPMDYIPPKITWESTASDCDHANEVPGSCSCDESCYCKEHSCKNRS